MKKLLCLLSLLILFVVSACGSNQPSENGRGESSDDADRQATERYFSCMQDRGFAVTRGADGTVDFQTDDQEEDAAFEVASKECWELEEPRLSTAERTDQLEREYDVLKEAHDCVREQGFDVHDFPSKQVYVESGGDIDFYAADAPVDVDAAELACADQFAVVDSLP